MDFFLIFIIILLIIILCTNSLINYIKRRNEFYRKISTYIIFEIDTDIDNIDLWLRELSNQINKKFINIKNKKIIIFDNQSNNKTTHLLHKFCFDKGILYTDNLCLFK